MRKIKLPKIKKIAVLTDEPSLRSWFANSLELVFRERKVEIPIIVVLDRKNFKTKIIKNNFNLRRILERIVFPLIVVNVQKLLGLFPPLVQKIPLEKLEFLNKSKIINCVPIKTGDNSIDLPTSLIKALKEMKVSVLINRSNLILKGNVLTCLPYGVWGFHLGNSSHRGARYLLKSYCEAETKISVTLQKLNEHIDGGDIVLEKSIFIEDHKSYKMFKNCVYGGMKDILLKGVDRISSGEKFYSPKKLGKLYKLPNVRTYFLDLFSLLEKEIFGINKYLHLVIITSSFLVLNSF